MKLSDSQWISTVGLLLQIVPSSASDIDEEEEPESELWIREGEDEPAGEGESGEVNESMEAEESEVEAESDLEECVEA